MHFFKTKIYHYQELVYVFDLHISAGNAPFISTLKYILTEEISQIKYIRFQQLQAILLNSISFIKLLQHICIKRLLKDHMQYSNF